jgi:hypothetical protein
MTLLRRIAFFVGLALLAATAHATIVAASGYGSPHSFITIIVAAGVGVSALVIGSAWRDRPVLALCLAAAVVAGEAFGLLSTAERLIVAREAAQAPLRFAGEAHSKAAKRVAAANAALASIPEMTSRLVAALAAKAAADATAQRDASAKTCLANCRALLQAQVDAAAGEVDAARAELAERKIAAEREVAEASAAFARHKAPESATPLADRIGIAAWALAWSRPHLARSRRTDSRAV